MDQGAITRYITETCDGVDVVEASGDAFFFYDPGGNLPPDRRLPFATLVTSDTYDAFSNLSRPSVYRLNVGISRDTFRALFDAQSSRSGEDDPVASGHDFTALDRIMPHPVYGKMFWVCVLNSSPATFQSVQPLLAEAHERAVRRHAKTRGGNQS